MEIYESVRYCAKIGKCLSDKYNDIRFVSALERGGKAMLL